MSGLAMEIALAWRYGASGMVDAYRIATLVAAFGAQLFFGYLLPHVVVPVFTEYRAQGSERDAWRLVLTLALILSLVTLPFVGWVWLDPQALVALLGPGLDGPVREDAVLLVRCFSLAFLLMAWSGIISGVLAVYRVFWLSSVAQLLPNLAVVLAIFAANGATDAQALAMGILSGYVAMLCLFAYGLFHIVRETGVRLSECIRPCSGEGLRKALRLSIPLVAAILAGQWGAIIINRALSAMPSGTLAEFGYAWKLLALTGLLPATLATVIFPAFADAHARDNMAEFSRLAARALRMTLFLTIPLAAALMVERVPVSFLILGRGGMSMQAVADIGQLFGILLLGAPAAALAATLGKIGFALHDAKSPAAVALVSALAFTALTPFAAESGGVRGVALETGLITWGGSLGLLGYLNVRYRVIQAGQALRYTCLLLVLCFAAALPVIAVRALFEWLEPMSFGLALLEVMLSGLVFIVTGYACARLMGIHEASEIGRYLKWQFLQISVFNRILRRR
jgi:putative peptidoglycan lipid II flippase